MAAAKLDTLQNVELAEGVRILLRPAGPVPRGFALIVDLLWCAIALFIAFWIMMGIGAVGGFDLGVGAGLLMFFIIYWGYFLLFEVLRGGQTPGKKSFGLRVVRTSGARVGWGSSFLRNLVRFADMMPILPQFGLVGFYLFGIACCLATRRFQRLGDLVADTVVIYDRRDPREDAAKLRNPVSPQAPPFVLSREEQQAFMQFLERASLWSDSRKEEMIEPLQEPLGANRRDGVVRALSIGAWVRDS